MIRRIFRPPILTALSVRIVQILIGLLAFSTLTCLLAFSTPASAPASMIAGVALVASAVFGAACRLPDTGRLRGTVLGFRMNQITRCPPNMCLLC